MLVRAIVCSTHDKVGPQGFRVPGAGPYLRKTEDSRQVRETDPASLAAPSPMETLHLAIKGFSNQG